MRKIEIAQNNQMTLLYRRLYNKTVNDILKSVKNLKKKGVSQNLYKGGQGLKLDSVLTC